jgi:hypothetical protein
MLAAHKKQRDPIPQRPMQIGKITWTDPRPVTANTNPKAKQINGIRVN